MQSEASNIVSSHLWCDDLDGVEKKAVQILKGEWDMASEYAHARIDYENWHVMLKNPKKSDTCRPSIRRVRVVKLVSGKHLTCSCNLFIQIGVCCRHVLHVSRNVNQHCFHVTNWKIYNFHYLREDTTEEMNTMFENLAFNDPIPDVLITNMASSDSYPVLSDEDMPLAEFENVLNSKWPIITNWPKEDLIEAARKTGMNHDAPLGMHHEFSQNIENELFDQCLENNDNYSASCSGKSPSKTEEHISLYNHMLPHVKEISKYESSMSANMRRCIDLQMSNILSKSIAHAAGGCEPTDDEIKALESTTTASSAQAMAHESHEDSHTYVSLTPSVDRRQKDKRIKQCWEV